MKKLNLSLALGVILLIMVQLQSVNVAKANPMYKEIPPKVYMPE